MKYLFILGRNIELSIQEVLSYFKRTGNHVKNYIQKKNSILVNIEKKIEENAIEKLGGVIAIGEVIDDYKNIELYKGSKNKINYVIWNFSYKIDKFRNYLKKWFKKEKLKATEKKLGRIIKMQSGEEAFTISSKNIDEQYFVFEDLFGRIIQMTDYEKIEKRDMEKPVRRQELAISPRLAKIMINLSEVKKGRLLDCFCGVGVILQEALLQGIPVVGVDIDKKAIESAKKNLEWGKFKNYKLIRADSKKVEFGKVEVLVSEPSLGKILKKIPIKQEAEKILKNFEKLIISVLNHLKKKISGKIVFTAPYIKTMNKRLSCDIKTIAEKTKLKIVLKIPEFRKNQIIGREIIVLENL